LLELAVRAFYAQQNARVPLFTAAFRFCAFILLGALFLGPLGVAGVALADSLAVTCEAMILLFLLSRQVPGLLRVGGTLVRATLVSLGAALLVYALLQLPFPAFLMSLASLAAGGLLVLLFILPEVKLLIKL
jgi:peptidoglycan biosynthesis protein MviN/MurJ (putative lipid II flippase)